MKEKRRIISFVLLAVMLLAILTGCGNTEPGIYNAPKGAPYEGLYEIDKMNSSTSYSYSKGVDEFVVTMNWKTEDQNIDYAQFTDEYYLEWSFEDGQPSELCEPLKDMSALKDKTYTIKPGEKIEIKFDIDTYFDELGQGYYRFVKVLKVVNKDGSSKQVVASFGLDLND